MLQKWSKEVFLETSNSEMILNKIQKTPKYLEIQCGINFWFHLETKNYVVLLIKIEWFKSHKILLLRLFCKINKLQGIALWKFSLVKSIVFRFLVPYCIYAIGQGHFFKSTFGTKYIDIRANLDSVVVFVNSFSY